MRHGAARLRKQAIAENLMGGFWYQNDHLLYCKDGLPQGGTMSTESTESTEHIESPALAEKPRAEVAALIADRLGETEEGPRMQIKRLVGVLGRTQALAMLEKTIQIEEQGGMMLPNGSRRRTPGGVYFHLAYTTGTPKPGKVMRRPNTATGKPQEAKQASSSPPATLAPTIPPFSWDDRIAAIEAIGNEKGRASTVKITLIGQLGKFEEKGTCVIGVMQHTGEKVPALPKGVPVPPAVKTNYVVYIGAKQWKNVAATVSDPEDALIIEGFPQIDTKTGAISVFASNVTSKKLQAAKRQQE
jgi:hypothetical protein